jgi:hypothetical protein
MRPSVIIGVLNKDGDDDVDTTAAEAEAEAEADADTGAAGDEEFPGSHELVTVRVNMLVSGSMVGGCGLAPPPPAPPPRAEPVNTPATAPCCAIDAEFKCSEMNVPPAKTGGAKYPTLPPTATATALEADLSCRQRMRAVWCNAHGVVAGGWWRRRGAVSCALKQEAAACGLRGGCTDR